jgi:hypothetical protein
LSSTAEALTAEQRCEVSEQWVDSDSNSQPQPEQSAMRRDEAKKSAATIIVDAVLDEQNKSVELWHTEEGSCHMSLLYEDGHAVHFPMKAKATRQYLQRLYHQQTGNAASPAAITTALATLEGYALEGPQYPVHVRIAALGDAIYVDLLDATWEAIRITAEGWEIIKEPPIKFLRPRGLKPLPRPEVGGSLEELKPLLNISDRETWLLVKGWLIGALSPHGPYAILAIAGEQGSAKTWLEKTLKSIIDPSTLPTRGPPRSTDDLMISANANHILSYDNLSRIKPWLSDNLCNLATGGGISKRELYSDMDETIIRVCRPIILNGIEDIVTRQDLLDRSIYISMPRIPEEKRRPEAELIAKFEQLHPMILGALLDSAVTGLQRKGSMSSAGLPRMADFAKYVMAALGDEGPEFLQAYKADKDRVVRDSLEGDPVVSALLEFIDLKQGEWSGTATELLGLLNAVSGYAYKRQPPGWPRAPNALSGILRRLAPALPRIGLVIEFSRDESIQSRVISIMRVAAV